MFVKWYKDEYDDVYEISRTGGCGFYYNKGNVSKSHILNSEELDDIPKQCISDDKLVIICKPCGCFMRFNSSFEKSFTCGICGRRVKHSTLINKLLKEIDEENRKYSDYDEYYG